MGDSENETIEQFYGVTNERMEFIDRQLTAVMTDNNDVTKAVEWVWQNCDDNEIKTLLGYGLNAGRKYEYITETLRKFMPPLNPEDHPNENGG